MTATVTDIRVFVETPKSLKPSIAWVELKNNLIYPDGLPKIATSKGLTECDSEKLLMAIGSAICDDRLAQGATIPEEVFTPETKFKVVSTVNRVLIKLARLRKQIVKSDEVHEICENCLLEEGETLAAKGYLLYRTQKQRRHQATKHLDVIRRNGTKVSWNAEKIFNAIYKAFLAELLERVSEPQEQDRQEATEKASKVTQAVVYEITSSGRDIIHIEEIQDVVTKYLAEMGFQAIAKRFSSYRTERALLRRRKEAQAQAEIVLPELVTSSLMARIDFALIDLDVSMNREALAHKLVHGMSIGLTEHEKMNTVLM
ncbi:MAG: hypothetical protein JSR46_01460, partial [Verrucomicrobia bacterium]|nr:hypothetical protein [Verrucomicrobiota bacterium]